MTRRRRILVDELDRDDFRELDLTNLILVNFREKDDARYFVFIEDRRVELNFEDAR